jgi:hypothetical protein
MTKNMASELYTYLFQEFDFLNLKFLMLGALVL